MAGIVTGAGLAGVGFFTFRAAPYIGRIPWGQHTLAGATLLRGVVDGEPCKTYFNYDYVPILAHTTLRRSTIHKSSPVYVGNQYSKFPIDTGTEEEWENVRFRMTYQSIRVGSNSGAKPIDNMELYGPSKTEYKYPFEVKPFFDYFELSLGPVSAHRFKIEEKVIKKGDDVCAILDDDGKIDAIYSSKSEMHWHLGKKITWNTLGAVGCAFIAAIPYLPK